MNISFCIIISENYSRDWLQNLVNSIEEQNFASHRYEILICGKYRNDILSKQSFIIAPYDMSWKGYLTKKRNTLINLAQYDVYVSLHDHLLLDKNWFEGLLLYTQENPNWDVITNRYYTLEGHRYYDWVVIQEYFIDALNNYPNFNNLYFLNEKDHNNYLSKKYDICRIPNNEKSIKHLQFILGGYFIAKTNIMHKVPFNENIKGMYDKEDVEWTKRLLKDNYDIDFNPYSIIQSQKPGKIEVRMIPNFLIDKMKEMFKQQLQYS